MAMKISRRTLLGLGIGATQLALLERFGMNRATAGPSVDGPTKLLSIWIPGGVNHEQMWCPLSGAGIAKFIPPPEDGSNAPYFYNAAMVKNYDGTSGDDGPYKKIRGPIWWNSADPSDQVTLNPASEGVQRYVPYGYSWVANDFGNAPVYSRAAMIHGIDQGTAAHVSGQIASMCGVAGGEFRAPAIAAVVASVMMTAFPDRPLPSVSLGGLLVPKALSTAANPMSSAVNPIFLSNVKGLEHTVSDHPESAWSGFRDRHDFDEVAFDGSPTGRKLPLNVVDDAVMRATRSLRTRSTAKTDALLQELHDTYAGVSRTLARDVVTVLEATKGVEFLPDAMPWSPNTARFGYIIGNADGGSLHDWDESFDLCLRLLKSDLVTSITLPCFGAEHFFFDTHAGVSAPHDQINNLRGTMEVIGRLLIEMMLTPSPSKPGKSLLDETLVHVMSDFGRTFPTGKAGTDHHPATTVILAGGNVRGNRMIGGYDESITGSPLGSPIEIIDLEEGGGSTTRVPRAADAAATIYRAYGLQAGKDFFIPGGYGEVAGVLT
jgi:hypothetical protein